MESIAKNSLANVICTVLDLLLQLIITAYCSRILLADGVGKVAYVQSIVAYFTPFASFGMFNYGIRETAKIRGEQGNLSKVFSELIVIHTFSTTVVLAAYILGITYLSKRNIDLPLFLAWGVSILVLYIDIDWLYHGQEEYLYIAGRNMFAKLLSLGAVFVLIRTREDYVKYALIASLTSGIIGIFNLCRAHKYVKLSFHNLSIKKHIKPLSMLAVNDLFTELYTRIDITMLGTIATKRETGYYYNANMAIRMIRMICSAALAVWYPRLSLCYQTERKEFDRLLSYGIKLMIFIAFPASAGIFILAPQIIMIVFGNSFLPAVRTFRMLSLLLLVQSAADIIYQILMVTGSERKRLPALVWGTAGNVLLNSFFIRNWADCGAAAASVICEVGVNGYLLWKVYHLISPELPWRAVWQAIISTLIMGLAVLLVIQIDVSPFLKCGMGVFFGILVYGLLNLFLKNELMEMAVQGLRNRM